MVTLENVEKLCERANITYDEAKALLEETNGDILEAIIRLEKDGRIMAPSGGGYYNSMNGNQNSESNFNEKHAKEKFNKEEGSSFSELMGKFFRWCGKVINKGNRNTFDVIKNGENSLKEFRNTFT
jgi:ribosomal protein L12E/L44/L45/RPP1/RPP2